MNLKRKLLVAVTLIAVIVLVQACRKFDFFSKEPKTPEFTIAEAKEWYYGVFKKTKAYKEIDFNSPFAPAFSGKPIRQSSVEADSLYTKRYPYWNKAIKYNVGGIQIVEMPIAYVTTRLVLPGTQNLTEAERKRIAEASLHKVVFIKTANGTVVARLVTLIPTIDYLKAKDFDISDNTMQKADNNFNGFVVIKDWNEKVINFRKVKNGKYTQDVRVIKSATRPGGTNANSKSTAQREAYEGQCGWISTPIIIRYCIAVSNTYGDIPGQEADDPECLEWAEDYQGDTWDYVDCGGGGTDPYDDCMQMGGGSEYCNCTLYGIGCEGSGGGGGGGDNPPQGDEDVVNQIEIELTDSCFQRAVDQINTANSLGNEIGSMLHETFTFWDQHDLFIKQNCRDSSIDAGTTPSGGLIVLAFNECGIQNASQEYIAATLYHEIIHAYFDAHGRTSELNQHIDMANKYVNAMKNTLMENFPNLTSLDAEALAWQGLQNTQAFINLQQADPNRAMDINYLNKRHRQGDWGTKCR